MANLGPLSLARRTDAGRCSPPALTARSTCGGAGDAFRRLSLAFCLHGTCMQTTRQRVCATAGRTAYLSIHDRYPLTHTDSHTCTAVVQLSLAVATGKTCLPRQCSGSFTMNRAAHQAPCRSRLLGFPGRLLGFRLYKISVRGALESRDVERRKPNLFR